MPARQHPTGPWRRLEDVPAGDPWQRLGVAANARLRTLRAAGVSISQETLSSSGGPSGAWFRRMCRDGQPLAAPFVAGIERALSWPSGYALKIINRADDDAPLPPRDTTLTIIIPPDILPDDPHDVEDVRLAAYRAAVARARELRDDS